MKKVLFIMMLGVMFGQSRTIIRSESIDENNPCKDEKFIMLKEKQLDEMSEREYKYFSQMSKDCSAYQTAERTTKPNDAIVDQQKKYWKAYVAFSILGIIMSLFLSI